MTSIQKKIVELTGRVRTYYYLFTVGNFSSCVFAKI